MRDAAIIAQSNDRVAQATLIARFKMFFAGLIFAILSFIGTHAIQTNYISLEILEVGSLASLLIAGTLLLLDLSEYRLPPPPESVIIESRYAKWYWLLFVFGMFLLILNRSILIFIN